jgi:peptidoglycan/LPS O-acetylase OafA/YrhL
MEFQLFRPVATVASLLGVGILLELIRRRRLKEELWVPSLLIAIAPMLASLWIAPWATVATWLGIVYEPALLLGLAIALCLVAILYLAVVVSTLMQRNLQLAQELALLGARLEQRRDGDDPGATSPAR